MLSNIFVRGRQKRYHHMILLVKIPELWKQIVECGYQGLVEMDHDGPGTNFSHALTNLPKKIL